ncbi:MAG: hypothetical protein R2853_16275 [Thermomicrobiales bacterium]
MRYLEMDPPVAIDPSRATPATDPYAIALVKTCGLTGRSTWGLWWCCW